MKNNIWIFVIVVNLLMFAACIDIKQETTFKEDGSGTFSMIMDLSNIRDNPALKQMGGPDASMEDIFEEMPQEVMDSVMYFKDMEEEGVAEAFKDRPDLLENAFMRIKGDKKKQELFISINLDFQEYIDVGEFCEILNRAQKGGSGGMGNMMAGGMVMPAKNLWKYKYSKKGFSYKFPKQDLFAEMDAQQAAMSKMMFKGADYEMVFHFPKKVKSVKHSDAKISPDGKTVTLSAKALDYMQGKVSLNNKVVFE